MKPVMTQQELEAEIRERCDLPTSGGPLTSAEIGRAINGSMLELYERLVLSDEDYYSESYTFTTDGTSDTYDYPVDSLGLQRVFKLTGVDVSLSGGAVNSWLSLHRFNRGQRNEFSGLNGMAASLGRGANMRYRPKANGIQFVPRAAAGQTVRLNFAPRPYPLVKLATITLSGFGVQSGGSYLVQSGTLTFGGDQTVDIDGFATLSNTLAAAQIATVITANLFTILGVTATASLGVITLTIPATVASVSYSSDTQYAVCSTDTIEYGQTSFDGFSGWLEYVVVDACRKAMEKQEKDSGPFVREKAALVDRIARAAANRDVGEPATSVDVNATGGWPSGDW